jgi:tetratricopeptide (TPR) repeat protein
LIRKRPHGPRKGWTAEKLAKREKALGPNRHGGFNHNTLGCELCGARLWEAALSEFAKAVAINPWNAAFKANAARAWLGAGGLERAEALIAQALRQEPSSSHVHFVAGMVAERRGDKRAALRYYRRCLALGAAILNRRDVRENIRLLEEDVPGS